MISVSGGDGHRVNTDRLQENADGLNKIIDEESKTHLSDAICVYSQLCTILLPFLFNITKNLPWPVFRLTFVAM